MNTIDSSASAEAKIRLYETILGATPDLVYVFDLQHRFIYANEALLTMWGRTWPEAAYKTCLELGYEPWHAAMHDEEIERVIATRAPVRGDVPFRHHRLGTRIYDYIFTPVIGLDGNVEAVAGTTRDVTDRKNHETRQQLLANELNHRVKNTLAIVMSISTQTFQNERVPAVDSFQSRLLALSKVHDVLTSESWAGATVEDIVRTTIAPSLADGSAQFALEGDTLYIDPRRAVALSMALHELWTNAIKHGALSVPEGRVQIRWRSVPAQASFTLEWNERGGPPVQPPSRRGFGSRLLERGLKHDLGGNVDLEFARAGVRFRLTAPLQP